MGEIVKMNVQATAYSASGHDAKDFVGELLAENSRLKRLLAELLIKNHELRERFRMASHASTDFPSFV